MARLNESTAPTEPIDILKRRFVRQNREIARVNSIQSLRIRTLESDVSNLLAENVSLREQVIMLSQELERFESAKSLHDGVYDIKTRLDDKLAELGNLVNELGTLPRRLDKSCHDRLGAGGLGQLKLSRSESTYRKPDPEINLICKEQGGLPVILEDKCYPRETLDREICTAPDPAEAPSPLSTIKRRESTPQASEKDLENIEILGVDERLDDEMLFSNLMTRKRQKPDPSASNDISPTSGRPSITELDETISPKRAGQKRKFGADREDEYLLTSIGDDDFQYSRPPHSSLGKDEGRVSTRGRNPLLREDAQPKRDSGTHKATQRKALEPKNGNLSIASPDEHPPTTAHDGMRKKSQRQKGPLNPVEPGEESICQQQGSFVGNFSSQCSNDNERKETNTHEIVTLPNKEPQKSESLSPAKTVSIFQGGSGMTSSLLNAPPSRPSRRQRSVVSYAEPNLRDKMRRPTNEFVPAVGGERLSKTSNTAALPESTDEGDVGLQTDISRAKKPESSPGTTRDHISILEKASGHTSRSPVNMVSLRKKKNILAKIVTAGEEDRDTLQNELSSGARERPNYSVENSKPRGCEDQNTLRISNAGRNNELDSQSTDDTGSLQRHVVAEESEPTPGRRRQPRRHSSHLKTSTQHTQGELRAELHSTRKLSTSGAPSEVPRPTMPAENADTDSAVLDEETGSLSNAMVGGRLKRGHRAVARRKSMML
ncbi:shugoshin family protein [Aspergillus fischeri NRRL 181]|uniref:Shugoshin C terminal domain protein n=1 Tax=Neosartorya fischeri (strain ATCC 1020 / DSM 3700 / CBS 544.65 / FGSC A1164 / JCM 1740 / NRRL 181 / WB 181) TaxID=331117 RepID=A1D3J9_NEOFI|nr:shugoshin C terminal domain protein [Aspergillus fischeri NRRL 181]EAW22992.1 shugoshin C terminal domain protein [Aspergillus fischeri NRRL 181]